MKSAWIAASALLLASCSPAPSGNAGVYMLVDTSGTYREELKKAEQIIRYSLSRLDATDTFAVARIDTGSFSEKDIVAKVTLDDRPRDGVDQGIVEIYIAHPASIRIGSNGHTSRSS
jgi:hypothetical protein